MIYHNDIQTDTLAVGIAKSASKTFTIEIDCFDGHELSGEVVANAVIEARQGTSGGWTDIETVPIDLSTFAALAQPVTFQMRVTASTVALTTGFRLRVGPPSSGEEFVLMGDGDFLSGDGDILIVTE